ncbi:MAG: hypothetical protein WCW65_03315, partial [Candidatus Paceibacterota bacterium]
TTTALAEHALAHNLANNAGTENYWTMLVGYNNTSKQMAYKTATTALNPGEGFWVLLGGTNATDTYIYTIGNVDH